MAKNAISPTREENFPEWYQQAVKEGELAENSPVRGCMVIKPWGYAIWENIQREVDQLFKKTGCQNAYFPLFIPLSFLETEAEHVEGFAKECAVVTHHRLEEGKEGGLVPAGELEEPLIVRPTSETIIGHSFAQWIKSYRDLPLVINQWANVVRWEMRTRLFLRSSEFLWNEGHTAHETEEEAWAKTKEMLDIYVKYCKEWLAIPVYPGEKSEGERFPGAVSTYTIEMMMQDRKALQGSTSHFLGQNFAKASNIQFSGRDGQLEYAWTTSWAITSRMIGALVMIHGDDDGVICPPRIAPKQIILIPIIHKEETREEVLSYCDVLATELRKISYCGRELEVEVDVRDIRNGEKTWSWIKKGAPVRIEVGPRDIAEGQLQLMRRDRPHKDRIPMKREEIGEKIVALLEEMQQGLYDRADAWQKEHVRKIDDLEEFKTFFTPKNKNKPEIHGGFALVHFCGDPTVEKKINNEYNVTIRCIPFDQKEKGICLFTGGESAGRVIFAKAY